MMCGRPLLIGIAIACLGMLPESPASAAVVYVNSRSGDDAYDGRSPSTLNQFSGPVRTLRRANQLLCPSDTLVLANTGVPYFGSLSLVCGKHSGLSTLPLEIIGNGAVISGARPIPRCAWREVATDVWSVTPRRKAFAQLSRGGETLPTFDLPWPLASLPQAPPDHWYLETGEILLKTQRGIDPRLEPFEIAAEEAGVTLLGVEYVIIRDVTFQHFRLDGVNLHDRCRNVVLDNVVCEGNGRAGVAVAGSSQVLIQNSLLTNNRRHSLLLTELGRAEVVDSELLPPASEMLE